MTVRQFEQILESAICFYDALFLMAEMVTICDRVHHCIAEQLCKKLFAPLYSTIFAVNAKICTCLGRLMLECDMQFENTRQFVKVQLISPSLYPISSYTIQEYVCVYILHGIEFALTVFIGCTCSTPLSDMQRWQS